MAEVGLTFVARTDCKSARSYISDGMANPVYQVQSNNVVTVHFPGGVNSSINGFIIKGYVPLYRSGWYSNTQF